MLKSIHVGYRDKVALVGHHNKTICVDLINDNNQVLFLFDDMIDGALHTLKTGQTWRGHNDQVMFSMISRHKIFIYLIGMQYVYGPIETFRIKRALKTAKKMRNTKP